MFIFILVSKADKIFLTQDRVLHRGALDAAQCHRAYAQVTIPLRDAVWFWVGWRRLKNPSCEGVTFLYLVGESPRKSLHNSKIWVKATFIVIDCYFHLLIVDCNLLRLDWPPILRGADDGQMFFTLTWPPCPTGDFAPVSQWSFGGLPRHLVGSHFFGVSVEKFGCCFFPVIDVFLWIIGWDRGNLGSLCFVCFLWGDDDVCPAFLFCDNGGCLDGFNYLWYIWIVTIENILTVLRY